MKKGSILIKNGRVIDPALSVYQIRSIAIDQGLLVDPKSMAEEEYEQVVDADGCIVTPGFMDFHTHLSAGSISLGTAPDLFFASGVTGVVDAGTMGCLNYEKNHRLFQNSYARTWSYLNMASYGFENHPEPEDGDPTHFDDKHIEQMLEFYPNELLGLKIRISKSIAEEWGIEPLRHTRELADRLGCSLVVHTTDPIAPLEEILRYFKCGDVFTHCYHGRGDTIIGDDGHICPVVWNARERGVIFCSANGTSHFSFKTAERALEEGFAPDIISTDNGKKSLYKRPVLTRSFSLPYVMSKYLAMGMSLETVIRCVTQNPYNAVRRPEYGCLALGTPGDVTISRLCRKNVEFVDSEGEKRQGKWLIKPEMTICAGVCTFRQIDFFKEEK